MESQLGKTLLIVNPAAKTGKGAAAGCKAKEILSSQLGDNFQYCETSAANEAVELAKRANGFDLVIALGGDGVIHEVVNGLMEIPLESRPACGIIPVGSGNDFSRTLGVSEDIETACEVIFQNKRRLQDIGVCNEHYFMETVSFGIDAAIALETVERRKRTNKTGTALYVEAGINQLVNHRDARNYSAWFDNGEEICASSLTFAVQIGKTYGGGFYICPDADPSDGLFDICIAHPPFGVAAAIRLFLKAKDGKHVNNPKIEMFQASKCQIVFEETVPAQMDGEDCTNSEFNISIIHNALQFVFA